MMEALEVRSLRALTTLVVRGDKNREVVTQEVGFQTSTSVLESFRQGLAMFFENDPSQSEKRRPWHFTCK